MARQSCSLFRLVIDIIAGFAFKEFHQVVVVVGIVDCEGEGGGSIFEELVMGDHPPIGFPLFDRVHFTEDLEHILYSILKTYDVEFYLVNGDMLYDGCAQPTPSTSPTSC